MPRSPAEAAVVDPGQQLLLRCAAEFCGGHGFGGGKDVAVVLAQFQCLEQN